MRTNLPVNNVETPVPDGEFIYSRTDPSGRILEANDLFVALSGFSREELIGQPHNLVRHPDMPREAFEDLWRCFKAGRPWNGYVKNRRKDGGYYWVHAFASPVRENGAVVGYESVRRRADPGVVKAVDVLYRRFREGRARGLVIRDGRVQRVGPLGWLGGLQLGARFGLGMAAILLAVLAVGVVGFSGLKAASASLQTVHADNMIPVGLLSDLRSQNNRARLNLALGAAAGAPVQWHADQIGESVQRARAQWQRYQQTSHGTAELGVIDVLRPNIEKVFAAIEDGRQRLLTGDSAGALRLAGQEAVPEYLKVVEEVEQLLAMQDDTAASAVAAAGERYRQALAIFGGLLALALAVTAYLYFGAVRSLVRDIRRLEQAIVTIQRDGDLRHIVAIERRDEIGRLASAFNAMMANTQAIMIQVRDSAAHLNIQSAVLADTSQQVAAGAAASSEAASSTAAAVEEVTVAIGEVAEHANAAASAADESSACSARGMETAGRAAQEIGKLAGMVAATTETIEKLASSSADIGRIATVIKEIADQTNLLALNAAIEAARAGEQGRGFAVVADEVRKLAERTTHATSDISSILDALRVETANAVASVRRGDDQVKVGVELAHSAQAALAAIQGATERSLQLVADIASATGEQSASANAISRNVEKIAEMAEEGAAAVNSVAGASKTLAGVSHNLDRAIARFKV
ncbi:hypothetical protein CJ010_14090 [Azoarcus sp. DD4]|uniref:methyl-accepting chemotaxis protein n=1 Tax=Azoarcus sp. DD4 TaxID=2027405 RepID=UPI00112A365E|nr:methyl-accepting chemotaxis protein [Azoarcus sp. DD4]QDF97586.1 hypothetical protein CJ010_14090 [Azoarcus sp. DD4]